MSGYTRTTILDCSRSQSQEAQTNNNQNPAQWTNRMGSGMHLKVGDQITVHSSYISELGCQTGEIQIKGQSFGKTTTKITNYEKLLRYEELPEKYALVNASNQDVEVEIRDDTLNMVVTPYKTSNGENYMFLPRRFGTRGASSTNGHGDWNIFDARQDKAGHPGFGDAVADDLGQTQNPQRPLNRCAADLIKIYAPSQASNVTPFYKLCHKNDNKRYTLFTKKQSFRGDISIPSVLGTGLSASGSPVITLTHGTTNEGILKGMILLQQSPISMFATGASVVSISGNKITMSKNASANASLSNSHNYFEFSIKSASADQVGLPPTTANSDYNADECEALRDPATLSEYIPVRNLISTKVTPGYNSPTDIAVQLTQELNESDETDLLTYSFSAKTGGGKQDYTVSSITETDCYKHYHCATATNFQTTYYDEWKKTNGTWDVDKAYNYLASFENIGIKRPELYITGCELNGSSGDTTDAEGEDYQASTDKVFMTAYPWNEENLLKWKNFFDAQAIYPELFDGYTQNGSWEVSVEQNRFFHMNLFDNASQNEGRGNEAKFAAVYQRSTKAPDFGYDLYNSSVSSSQTSFPCFIDYNVNTSNKKSNEVGSTFYGNDIGRAPNAPGMEPDYEDLAYGFARKVLRKNPFVPGTDEYIGFQFTKTGNQIPQHFFHPNASQSNLLQLGIGMGRTYGFDRHFTAYGNSMMLLYNGNVVPRGYDLGMLSQRTLTFGQQVGQIARDLDPYQFGLMIGADSPIVNYDDTQQRFTLESLHTAEKVGNVYNAGLTATVPGPTNPDADEDCYKINKRELNTNFTPELTPYNRTFKAKVTNGSTMRFVQQNPNLAQYEVFDAHSGLFIEDWLTPENLWNQSLPGVMGFRYSQFHNPNSTNSRQVRITAHGANADLDNVNIITTNANVTEADIIGYSKNLFTQSTYQITNPVAVGGLFTPNKDDVGYVTPAVTVSPATSVKITAERLPTKTLRPYYAIRSDILLENNYLGGKTSGITLPIVSITNKANPYGDYLNGQGEITFTNTLDRVITNVRCSIHEPDGSFARVDLDSAVIFKIDQQMPATLDLVSELLASKAAKDRKEAMAIEEAGPAGLGL